MYEESLRVPMISSYDYFPTILDYLGIPAPAGKRPGRSYAGFLRGARPQWRNRLYFEYEYVRGIRTENLKYIERTKEWPSELFDLESDPGETRNAINDPRHKKQLEALRAELKAFFKGNGAPPIEDWRSTTKQNLQKYQLVP
jgi:arylsulfatase A-like enzyme